MRRFSCLALLLLSAAAQAGMPFTFPVPPRRAKKPNPAVAALRDYTATLHTTLGDLAVELDPDDAPNAVRNFIKLAQQGTYDGARIYCVFKDRMLLAGDPTGTGKGDNGTRLPFEPTAAPHLAGSLAMDRLPDEPATKPAAKDRKETKEGKANSGSRFFISVADQRHLDRDYTVFGAITEGLDVAKRIAAAATTPNDGRPAPLEDLVIERITITKTARKADEAAKSDKSGE